MPRRFPHPEPRGSSISLPTEDGTDAPASANQLASANFCTIDLPDDETRQFDFSPLPPRLGPGSMVGGFEVISEIACRSLSAIFRAYQISRSREVALKVLAPQLGSSPAAVRRFRREASLAMRVAHPGVVPAYGHGFDSTYHYYAMKLMREPTLAESIDNALGARGKQFFRETAILFADLARTVASLHAHGILHRDLKPANIFLVADTRLVVADFGVAREFGHGAPREPETEVAKEESVMGTPAYMAPECFTSQGHSLDLGSDVYSLGLTLYEAITGVLPFPRCSDEEMARLKLTRKPPSPRTFVPELPLGLEAIVRQAVETNRDLRYRNAIDMARDLERFANYRRVDTREHPGAGNYDGDGDGDGDTERDDDAPEMALA